MIPPTSPTVAPSIRKLLYRHDEHLRTLYQERCCSPSNSTVPVEVPWPPWQEPFGNTWVCHAAVCVWQNVGSTHSQGGPYPAPPSPPEILILATTYPPVQFVKQSAATLAAASTVESFLTTMLACRRQRHPPRRSGRLRRPRHRRGRQAPTADKNVKLVAMADAFKDRLDDSLAALKGRAVGDRVDVPADRQYVGFDAYKTRDRPGRRRAPDHHAPLPADPPGLRRREGRAYASSRSPSRPTRPASATSSTRARRPKKKNLSVVSGLCWRYHTPRRETMKRVADGAIGDIVAVETTYNSNGVWDPQEPREQCELEMEYQMRNWYYYTWLSGDHIVEQAVHGLDTMGWALGDKPPIQLLGLGRPSGPHRPEVRQHLRPLLDRLRIPQQRPRLPQLPPLAGADNRVKDYVLGAKGTCDVFGHRITGAEQAGATAGRRTTCTRPSTTSCSPPSARASRSTTASTPPAAPCWRSWAGWPPTPAR